MARHIRNLKKRKHFAVWAMLITLKILVTTIETTLALRDLIIVAISARYVAIS